MKVYTGINLAKSFEDLKLLMNKADERANSKDEYGLSYAYGMLKGAIKGHILACTDTPSIELFPKPVLPAVDQEIEQEMKDFNDKDDIKDII